MLRCLVYRTVRSRARDLHHGRCCSPSSQAICRPNALHGAARCPFQAASNVPFQPEIAVASRLPQPRPSRTSDAIDRSGLTPGRRYARFNGVVSPPQEKHHHPAGPDAIRRHLRAARQSIEPLGSHLPLGSVDGRRASIPSLQQSDKRQCYLAASVMAGGVITS